MDRDMQFYVTLKDSLRLEAGDVLAIDCDTQTVSVTRRVAVLSGAQVELISRSSTDIVEMHPSPVSVRASTTPPVPLVDLGRAPKKALHASNKGHGWTRFSEDEKTRVFELAYKALDGGLVLSSHDLLFKLKGVQLDNERPLSRDTDRILGILEVMERDGLLQCIRSGKGQYRRRRYWRLPSWTTQDHTKPAEPGKETEG